VVVGFALVAAWEIVSAAGVIGFRRPIYNALSLVANMLGLAVLFLMLNAQFLFAAQVIVYAGAVMVLFVFIIALLNPLSELSLEPRGGAGRHLCGVVRRLAVQPGADRQDGQLHTSGHQRRRQRADDRHGPLHAIPLPGRGDLDPVAGRGRRCGVSGDAEDPLMPVPAYVFLLLSGALFTMGAIGFLVRRNPLVVFMCIELMLNAVNLAFAAESRYLNSLDGVVFAFLVITVAAAEVVVGIAIIVQVYRSGRQMDVDELDLMKE
jgi:NADH-quinone oxidoreductase subunit K